jgi:hypothetical protein
MLCYHESRLSHRTLWLKSIYFYSVMECKMQCRRVERQSETNLKPGMGPNRSPIPGKQHRYDAHGQGDERQ